jgi:hypothetical protein
VELVLPRDEQRPCGVAFKIHPTGGLEMTDLLTHALAVAAVKFKWQKGDDQKTYDYLIPNGLELAPGDKVIVETKKGETEVEVVEVRTGSQMASKPILRRAEPKEAAPAEAEPVEDWNF